VRKPVVGGLVAEEPELGKALGRHQEIAEGPPGQKEGDGREEVPRRESIPADEEADRVIGRFGDGVEKRDVLGPEVSRYINETRDQEAEHRKERTGEEQAGGAERP
jgi:hypothetical protein